jgi:hypothetical protein
MKVAAFTASLRQLHPFPISSSCRTNRAPSSWPSKWDTRWAAELSSIGVDIDFAPVLDVLSNPTNTVIGDRALSG